MKVFEAVTDQFASKLSIISPRGPNETTGLNPSCGVKSIDVMMFSNIFGGSSISNPCRVCTREIGLANTGAGIASAGAATGIGQAFSLACASYGAKIIVADMNSGVETVELIKSKGGEAKFVEVDV